MDGWEMSGPRSARPCLDAASMFMTRLDLVLCVYCLQASLQERDDELADARKQAVRDQEIIMSLQQVRHWWFIVMF